MQEYRTTIIPVPDLPETALSDMSRIYLDHYDGSDKSRFRRDLTTKNEALLVYQRSRLVGFTLYQLYRETWQGKPIQVIYSGDTVVEHAHWGQQALAFTWINRAGQLKQREQGLPLYWLLIVKGHRTYRYLPAFSRTFHPHWSQPSGELKPLADRLATSKFGNDYDPTTGVISFSHSRGHLKTQFAHPTARETSKASVRFFLQRNPGYLRGEELVCLCELSEANLKPMTRRLFAGSR